MCVYITYHYSYEYMQGMRMVILEDCCLQMYVSFDFIVSISSSCVYSYVAIYRLKLKVKIENWNWNSHLQQLYI